MLTTYGFQWDSVSIVLGLLLMAFFVFFVALLNVALGFALAVWLGRERRLEDELEIISALGQQDPREVMERNTPLPPTDASRCSAVPTAWLDLLTDLGKRDAFLATVHDVFSLNYVAYREKLVGIDAAVRRHRHGEADRSIGDVVADLQAINEDWAREKSNALDRLSETDAPTGDLAGVRHELEMVLEQQAAQIETVSSNLSSLDLAADVSDGCRRLLGELGKLFAMVHDVRDSIFDAFTQVIVHEKQLETLEQKLLVDSSTGLYGRTGFEAVTWEWWQDDPTRQRQVSIAMLDVDNFVDLNERFGPIVGDQLLFALAQLLRNAIRDERGYDVATRISGQRFVLFFGDTGARNAVTAMERIRRIVEESEVQMGATKIRLKVNAGVTPILQSDTTLLLLARAAGAVDAAKRDGGNCTRVDEGDGPAEMQPPELNVSGRTVLLEV